MTAYIEGGSREHYYDDLLAVKVVLEDPDVQDPLDQPTGVEITWSCTDLLGNAC